MDKDHLIISFPSQDEEKIRKLLEAFESGTVFINKTLGIRKVNINGKKLVIIDVE